MKRKLADDLVSLEAGVVPRKDGSGWHCFIVLEGHRHVSRQCFPSEEEAVAALDEFRKETEVAG